MSYIGPNVVVEAMRLSATNCYLAAGSYIGARSQLGEGSRISANVSIYHDVSIGCQRNHTQRCGNWC